MGQTTNDGWRERLREAIEKSGRTRQDISIDAGLGRAFLYGVFSEGKVPSIENLIKLCRACNASPAYVIFGWHMTSKHEELMDLLEKDPAQLDALLTLLRARQG